MAFKPVSRQAAWGHMGRDAALQAYRLPRPPHTHLLLLVSAADDTRLSQHGCNNVLLSVSCRMKPQNDNAGHRFV